MNLPFWIARRYFYAGKVRNVIHIISRISQFGITVGTIALIVILSVFNGFEDVVISLYNSFDSDIRITADSQKYFEADSLLYQKIRKIEGVRNVTGVIEENVLVKSRQNQTITTLKAIDSNYISSTGIDSMMLFGDAVLQEGGNEYAIVGSGVAGKLGLNLFDNTLPMQVYFPRKGNPNAFLLAPEKAFTIMNITPAGIFSIQQDFDSKYILVPLDFMRTLVSEKQKVTAIEVSVLPRTDIRKVLNKVREITGKGFQVRDRFQQHTWLYKIMRSEKFMVFLILSLILIIAAFNLVGSLLMLSLEKKKDMMILRSMGAESHTIRNIIFFEGMMLSMFSALAGLALGALICFLQMKFQLIKLNSSGTFVLDAYPVSMRLADFVWVFVVVLLIGFLSSWFPARSAYKELTLSDLHK